MIRVRAGFVKVFRVCFGEFLNPERLQPPQNEGTLDYIGIK